MIVENRGSARRHRYQSQPHPGVTSITPRQPNAVSRSKSRAERMAAANAGANDPPVSILNREFLPGPRHTPCTSSRRPDEAFAAKHMPDLGHDVREFRAFHWSLQGWKRPERKSTSPEFDCGGHKWYVARSLSRLPNSEFHPGGYYSFRPVTPTPLRLALSLSILIMSTPRPQTIGMPASNSR